MNINTQTVANDLSFIACYYIFDTQGNWHLFEGKTNNPQPVTGIKSEGAPEPR